MRERDFYKYVRNIGGTAPWEVKLARGGSIPFAALKDHQIKGLLDAKEYGILYKFPDTGVSQAPYDGIMMHRKDISYAWVIIVFYEPRKKKTLYYIDIDEWLKERNGSVRKSLTEERAEAIAYKKDCL